jgi:hypothetical protein
MLLPKKLKNKKIKITSPFKTSSNLNTKKLNPWQYPIDEFLIE